MLRISRLTDYATVILAVLAQERRELGNDLAIGVIERGLHRAPTDVEVATRLRICGHAQHGADRFAIDEDDPLVALHDLGQVALRDRPARARAGRGLEDRRCVGIAVAHHEDPEPTVTVDRLDDDRATLRPLKRAPNAHATKPWLRVEAVANIEESRTYDGTSPHEAKFVRTQVYGDGST